MNVLVACEFSGVVREAFRKRGHNAYSCDLLPAKDKSPYHHQCDVRLLLHNPKFRWDLMIAHPTCTYLCNSGVHLLKKTPKNPGPKTLYGPARWTAMKEAADFFNELWRADIEKIAIENPIPHGYAASLLDAKYSQIIQPYQFGHDASKQTCLWLKGLERLRPTRIVPPRIVNGRRIWGNQTPSGQNKLGPSTDRWALRSITYSGIAEAMAEQWG